MVGFHAFSIQYGTGAASNFSNPGNGTSFNPNALCQSHRSNFSLLNKWCFRRTISSPSCRSFFISGQKMEIRNMTGTSGFRLARDRKFSLPSTSHWQWKAGFDHTHSSGQYDGWLRKITIAPQIGAGRKFFSRPVLRAFLTYANWSDGLRGFVGGTPYQNRTNGLTYGVQAEHWW